jgi:DNA polymerase-3 subunit delta'
MKEVISKSSWPLVGNSRVNELLRKSMVNNNLAGTYIFSGPEDVGKSKLAFYFAQTLLCEERSENAACGRCPSCQQFADGKISHSDLRVISKEEDKKNISIDQAREFIQNLGMSSFLNTYKIGIIKQAEDLSDEAANALLKILEEPKAKVIIILTVANLEQLPATIVSRGQIINFSLVASDIIYDYLVDEEGASRPEAKIFSRLALGRPALAVKFLHDKKFYESYLNKAKAFLSFPTVDLNQRFVAIEKLVGAKSSGQETVGEASEILNIWESAARDLYLVNYNEGDLIQHEVLREEIEKLRSSFNINNLLKIFSSLNEAKQYLRANVNPKLALEGVAVDVS